ncbi:ribonuclease H-like domain-containing protein [Rhizophagus clarus]|uniref:Ribonuclease H-like domain-containing protein n=1 Tax=Rhizophagus clarus TaxID=94130 RepID=A0A8H3LDY1_9GLOM|nr:ribonuclease H-like domain-containing protein [Rhizophagus clarus]
MKPISPTSTPINQNDKRPIVPTNSNHHLDPNANARTLKQQSSIQTQLNAMHEKQLIEAKEKISKLENALNALTTKYEMLEQQIKTINTQHNTQNKSIDNLKQDFSKITKQVDDYQTTQQTINNKLNYIIEKISKNSPTPSHHSTSSHKTPYEHIARKQYNDDSLHINNLSKYQEVVPEMDIDYNQPPRDETYTQYDTSSLTDHKPEYGLTNPKSDTDTDNHTINDIVPSLTPPLPQNVTPHTTNINFENRPILNLNDLLTLNVINKLNPNSYPSYNPDHNQYFIDYVRIGIINIQSSFNTKKDDINLFFIQENFDILGLTELGLITSDEFPKKEYFDNHVIIYDTSETNDRNSGVALIVSKPFCKHIAKTKTYKGCLIFIDLFFKNHPVRIINTYIHANNTKTQSIKDLTDQLFQLILEANTNNYNLIVMDILRKIKRFNLSHSIKYFQNKYLAIRTPQISHDSPTPGSCIDHIYVSQNILDATFNSNTLQINNTFFNTDHKCVYILIDQKFFRSRKNLKASQKDTYRPNNRRRKTFNYNFMNKDKWSKYNTESKTQLDKLLALHNNDHAQSNTGVDTSLINKKWSNIKTIIDNSKLQTIPTYKSLQHYNLNTPLPLRQKFNKILTIHNVFTLFNRKKIIHCNPDLDSPTQWSKYWSSWPSIEEECIKHFQLLNSPLAAINNVLIFHSIQDLPIEFQELYSPIFSINSSIYNSVISPITIIELKDFINKLPLYKSAGNSEIHYEDLKHLHEDVILLILDLFNNILLTGIIPQDWNHALLYLIPKPKDWGLEINNTRPIILLESTRKLFTKILTSRLHQILSRPNIIQPNNRASLIGESTLQPLQHLHHAIEMANIQGKTIWIGLQDLSKAYDRINISLLKLSLKRLNIPDVVVNLLCNLFSNRYNQIILPNHLSREYNIFQGIDQGEVVSPLMWIIYYDPLFAMINQDKSLHYSITTNKIQNILQPDKDLPVIYTTSVQSYLDDTTWITDSLEKMRILTEKSRAFYNLANIQINVDKYKFLTNDTTKCGQIVNLAINANALAINIKTTGGRHPIVLEIPDINKQDIKSLRKKRIMFMDQVCFIDGSFLLPYKDIKKLANNKWKGKVPNWYQKILRNNTLSQNLRLVSPLEDPPIQNIKYNTLTIVNNEEHTPRNQWIVFWDANTSTAIYGKALRQINQTGANSITQIQHYVPLTPIDNQLDLTLRKCLAILKPCRSCNRHIYNVDNPLLCIFYMSTSLLITFKTTPDNKIPMHIPDKKKSWRYPSQPFLTLRTLAYNYFLNLNCFFKHPIHVDKFIDTSQPDPLLNFKDFNYNFIPNTPYFICNIFAGNDNVIQSLINLSIEFVNRLNFSFYTDGSLHTDGPLKSHLGFRWLKVGSPPHTFTFKGSMFFQLSSMRAEIFSIFTCLITVPNNSIINIYTDSQNFISTYNNINNPCFSHRKLLKINNHHTWQALLHLIKQKSLQISLHKVKAHDDDILNNSADLLAKEGCTLDPIFLNPQTSPNALMVLTFNLNGPLEKDLRKWSKNTLECCFNIKSFNHTLPTSDLQQRNYPKLFPSGPINCTACNTLIINNGHIGFCPTHLNTLNNSLQKIKESFILKLIDASDVLGLMDIRAWDDNSSSRHVHGINITMPQKPIPRDPFKFDQKLFIYLNSSNYLHSEDWLTYLDLYFNSSFNFTFNIDFFTSFIGYDIFDQPIVIQFYNELTKNWTNVKYGLSANLSLCEKFQPCQIKFTLKEQENLKKEDRQKANGLCKIMKASRIPRLPKERNFVTQYDLLYNDLVKLLKVELLRWYGEQYESTGSGFIKALADLLSTPILAAHLNGMGVFIA